MTEKAVTTKLLQFSIGPVQSWISQARRTQDLWAGSFLLSWLSTSAMAHVVEKGGEIITPWYDDKEDPFHPVTLLTRNSKNTHYGPLTGRVPNHFKAYVPSDFDAHALKNHVYGQWVMLAEKVWQYFIKEPAKNNALCRKIWDFQIGPGLFWEINWAVGDKDDQHQARWMDFRKNWRDHMPPAETELDLPPGMRNPDYCTMVQGLWEISGYSGIFRKEEQSDFWEKIRDHLKIQLHGSKTGLASIEIRQDERLSAVALVKRLFPYLQAKVIRETIGWLPCPSFDKTPEGNNQQDEPWQFIRYWPSTAYMAASHWVNSICHCDELENDITAYIDAIKVDRVYQVAENTSEIKICCLRKSEKSTAAKRFATLDGSAFFASSIASGAIATSTNEKEQLKAYANFTQAVKQKFGKAYAAPGSYYAMLYMDGDNIGKQIRQNDNYELNSLKMEQEVSKILNNFMDEVADITDKHNGILIYAGADDLMALFPIEDVLNAAEDLRSRFEGLGKNFTAEKIDDDIADIAFKISAAVVFSHYKNHYGDVRKEAAYLLEDIAKDRNGRNSIALSVLKPGGRAAQWVCYWGGEDRPDELFYTLVEKNLKKPLFASRLLYLLNERYGDFFVKSQDIKNKVILELPVNDPELLAIMTAEFMSYTDQDNSQYADTSELIKNLFHLMAHMPAPPEGEEEESNNAAPSPGYRMLDGLYILRFLIENWRKLPDRGN